MFLVSKTKEVFTCIWNGEWLVPVLIVPCLDVREQTSQEPKVNHHNIWTLLLLSSGTHNSQLIHTTRSYQLSVQTSFILFLML